MFLASWSWPFGIFFCDDLEVKDNRCKLYSLLGNETSEIVEGCSTKNTPSLTENEESAKYFKVRIFSTRSDLNYSFPMPVLF